MAGRSRLHRRTADRKARTKCTDDGLAVHSFRSLLGDLEIVTHNTIGSVSSDATFVIYPQFTPGAGPRHRTARGERQAVASKRDPQDSNPRVASNSCVSETR